MARNHVFEQMLTKQGVGFEYVESLPMEDINMKAGIRNQARLLQPLDEELVNIYAQHMKDGCEFPAVVLARTGKGLWIPVDGNQRLAALEKNGRKRTDAYLLDTKDAQVIDRLTWTFNNLVNGKRLTHDEALHHAVTFVRKYGHTIKQAAREWNINQWTLQTAVQAEDVQDVLTKEGIRLTPSMNATKLQALNPLMKLGEDVVAKAGAVVNTSGVSVDEVKSLVAEVAAASTSEAKARVIDSFGKSDRVQTRRGITKNGTAVVQVLPRDRVLRALKDLDRVLFAQDVMDKKALRPVGEEYKEARELAKDVVAGLVSLFGLGTVPKGE